MKKLLIILSIISFYSCTKCANCARTWITETYNITNGVENDRVTQPLTEVEYFDVCGSSEIKNAEKAAAIITSQVIGGTTYYTSKKSTCNCTTN